ncbi:hypothetical protein SAMN02745121_08945 [Nannocystis exedens]|uniref:Uncharacterized protein n=2 Tax=Nannocystis exedens TaxID=54 RepID=A0A1I2IU65_9BACT|nr:hypothetical protein NAEX_02474 [Nannocystis exedens]SFF45153.1 hypothetical protein SAMN02745121_08945 [Nannocystis exedens]
MRIPRAVLSLLLLFGCDASDLAGAVQTCEEDAASNRTAGEMARDFLTFVEGAPALDAYQRYLVAMARELDGSRPFVWPKIDCEGSHDGSQCWSVTCTCHNVRSCNMLAEWCNAVEAEEHGMSCTRAESRGCEK